MSFLPQSQLELSVLHQLFLQSQVTDRRLNANQVAARFKFPVSSKRVGLAFEALENRRDVTVWNTDGSASITGKGYQRVEEGLVSPDSFFAQYHALGDEWLSRQTIVPGGIPASDRVVTQLDNSQFIAELDEDLSKLQDVLRTDNAVGDALGDNKELIAGEVEAAKILTKHRVFRLNRLLGLLLPGLRFLADKFASSAVGETAKRLIELLLSML